MTAATRATSDRSVSFPFDPVPASRPKVSRYGTHYSKSYAAWRTAAAQFLEGEDLGEPMTGPLAVIVENICRKPRTSKLAHPKGDVDNYAKAALDALKDIAWTDDRQVVVLVVSKRFAEAGEEPRTEVNWRPL